MSMKEPMAWLVTLNMMSNNLHLHLSLSPSFLVLCTNPRVTSGLSQTLPFSFLLFSRSPLVYLSDICTLRPKLESLKGGHLHSVNKLEESVNSYLYVVHL